MSIQSIVRSSRFGLTLACLALCCAGCTRAVNRTAERRLREALPDAIGPARQYRVHVDSAPMRSVEGRFANVTIDGDDVRFPTGLLLDNVHIDMSNVDIDAGRKRVRHIGDARFTIIVSDRSLDQFLAGESPAGETVRKARLEFGVNSVVTVVGERVTLLNVGIPFRLTGPIRIASPTRLEIDPRRLVVGGIPLSGSILSFFKNRIESSLDLRRFPAPVQLTSVSTVPGRMILSGAIDAEALLRRAREAQ